MTNLQKLRTRIQDKEAEIFTDEEVNEVLNQVTKRKVLPAQRASLDGTVYRTPENLEDSPEVKLYDVEGNALDGIIDGNEILFDEGKDQVFIEAKFVNLDQATGTLLEIIATDIQKWNSYSVGGLSENFSKEELLNYARSMMPIKGAW